MEHAGVTFLREESVLFRVAPTNTDRLNRDILVLHELTHQWFGDLVTMRWFDDLWLKEGFAEYMAYQTLASLKPDENIWKRFYEANKPAAYAIDSTQGTTPIYQDIPNLVDAKSAYGAIVYDKAPGVLKQLAFVLGPGAFRDGLRLYLKEHAYGNAEWSDLVRAFEARLADASRPLGRNVDSPSRHAAGGRLVVVRRRSFESPLVVPKRCAGHGRCLADHHSGAVGLRIRRSGADTGRAEAANHGTAGARASLARDLFLPMTRITPTGVFFSMLAAETAVMEQIGAMPDVFHRSLLWGSLWDSVRQAELAPRDLRRSGGEALAGRDATNR